MEIWLKENKSELNSLQIQKIQKNIDYKYFLNYKTSGKYLNSIKVLLNSKISLFNFKNLFVLFTPNIILKNFLWFHNDFD